MLNRNFFSIFGNSCGNLEQEAQSRYQQLSKSWHKISFGLHTKTAAKVTKVNYLIKDREDKAKNVDNFAALLSLKWSSVFGDDECQVVTSKPG